MRYVPAGLILTGGLLLMATPALADEPAQTSRGRAAMAADESSGGQSTTEAATDSTTTAGAADPAATAALMQAALLAPTIDKVAPALQAIVDGGDKWTTRSAWRAGRDADVSVLDTERYQVLECLVAADAGMLAAAGRYDMAGGRRYAGAQTFFQFAHFFLAGAAGEKFRASERLLSDGSQQIRSRYLRQGLSYDDIAGRSSFCFAALDED